MRRLICTAGVFIALAQMGAHAQSLTDGVAVHKWSEFKQLYTGGWAEPGDCAMLTYPLAGKVHGGLSGEAPLTDAEYVELVGDQHPYFGIEGGRKFYVRSTGRIEEPLSAYLSAEGYDLMDPDLVGDPEKFAALQRVMQSFSPDMIPDDTPVLCGDGSEEDRVTELASRLHAEKVAAREEYERTCEACTLPGGPLLQAIFDGDYARQNDITQTYLSSIAIVGGREVMAAGTLINAAAGTGDLTMLEDLIGYYMLSTSRKWDDACYGPGAQRVTFTTEYPEQVYQTLGGVEIGRDSGYTRVTEYRVNPKFQPACDRLCNRNGGILLTAKLASGFGEELAAVKVFRGVDGLIGKYSCNSPELAQFEDNLLSLWQQERAQPAATPRNTIGAYFK